MKASMDAGKAANAASPGASTPTGAKNPMEAAFKARQQSMEQKSGANTP